MTRDVPTNDSEIPGTGMNHGVVSLGDMTCNKCDRLLEPSWNYCPRCGSAIVK